jgi:glutamine---fructose-6-phosphate transaminase (isomerizing)
VCGIVGYIGKGEAVPVILQGLRRLEYRGYDSAGISVFDGTTIRLIKDEGKISRLEKLLGRENVSASVAIGHTRWATHGEPNQVNAHPHLSNDGKISLVHNGIIENYLSLKQMLREAGFHFHSDTDTEVLVNLIQYHYDDSLQKAVSQALRNVVGAYGIAVMHQDHPDCIVAARRGSPLVLGIGQGENFIVSDPAACIAYTQKMVYLDDNELSVIRTNGVETFSLEQKSIDKKIISINLTLDQIEKGGYDHFMLKEIHEQPKTIQDAMRGRLNLADGTTHLGGLHNHIGKILWARDLHITACGTSWHAALIGQHLLEQFVRKPVNVDYASEFRYRDPLIGPESVVFVISQSGETADTLAAMRLAKEKGATVLGLVNVVGSTIARETDGGVYIHAGPEIGVASTKAFTSQVTALALLSLELGRQLGTVSMETGQRLVRALAGLPAAVESILKNEEQIKKIAGRFTNSSNFLYLGRGYHFPVALEGALKMKEISYIHAEGYPAAEMKHGPIALIDEKMPVVVIAPQDKTYEKIISNIQEVKARKGEVIAITTPGDEKIRAMADHIITIPGTEEFIQPILSVIPLQLLSYYVAVNRGCNVDQPRNLAKSVTVE